MFNSTLKRKETKPIKFLGPSSLINDVLVSSDVDCNIITHLLSLLIKPAEKCQKVKNSPYSFLFPFTTSVVKVLWIHHCILFRVHWFTNVHSICIDPFDRFMLFSDVFLFVSGYWVSSRLNLYPTGFGHFGNFSVYNWTLKLKFHSHLHNLERLAHSFYIVLTIIRSSASDINHI